MSGRSPGLRAVHKALTALALLIPVAASARGHAQAVETATRVSEISVFGQYQYLHPDYGPRNDSGIIAGVNYTRFFRSILIPSFELRATYAAKGATVGEETGLGGVRVDLHLRRFDRLRPYADFLVGAGQINFTHPVAYPSGLYAHDNSVVLNYGVGADYDIFFHLALEVEYQFQHWNIGSAQAPDTLTPSMLGIGLRYRIPFRPHTRQ